MDQTHILLIEDNEGDILLTTDALEERNSENKVSIAKDGWKAIEFFEKAEKHNFKNLPDLVLLDINLPKMNGHEVLKYLKNNENLKHIPVIILTTSSAENDIMQSYRNAANSYITKPVDSEQFQKVIETIEDFWIGRAKLPKE